jgi:hypothetical protein
MLVISHHFKQVQDPVDDGWFRPLLGGALQSSNCERMVGTPRSVVHRSKKAMFDECRLRKRSRPGRCWLGGSESFDNDYVYSLEMTQPSVVTVSKVVRMA